MGGLEKALAITVIGVGLIGNVGGAADWWIRYNERQRQLTWLPVFRYDRDKTRSLGRVLFLLGLSSLLIRAVFASHCGQWKLGAPSGRYRASAPPPRPPPEHDRITVAIDRLRVIVIAAAVIVGTIVVLTIALADDDGSLQISPATVIFVQSHPGLCRTLPISSNTEARQVAATLLRRSSRARAVLLAWLVSIPWSRRISEVVVALKVAGYHLSTLERTPALVSLRATARIQTSERSLLTSAARINRLAGRARGGVVGLASPPNACDDVHERLAQP